MDNKGKTIRRMLHTAAGLRIRESGDGSPSRTITGRAILFNTPSAPLYDWGDEEAREIIAPEAVTMELLDGCDIKMTMFHNRELILARSKNGNGTLSYFVDDEGVGFEFDAPETADGDKALELVRRGDLAGCSFAFTTEYYNRDYVSMDAERRGGKTYVTYTVRTVTGIYDFTLAADPAYPDTTVEAEQRELFRSLRKEDSPAPDAGRMAEQVRRMRQTASKRI